jgi:hypothetical protein
VIFLLKYHQNPQVLKRQSIKQRERKIIEKKKEKEEEKEKHQESFQIKGKSIF